MAPSIPTVLQPALGWPWSCQHAIFEHLDLSCLDVIVNAELERLVREAGAPEEVMDQLWFAVFCQQFAHLLISEMEMDQEADLLQVDA
jgi:hypothetical protein